MIFESIPQQITAGDSIQWTAAPDGYEVNLYSFRYALQSDDGVNQYTVVQDGFSNGLALFTILSADSAVFVGGNYFFQMFAFDTATPPNRTQIQRGFIKILADLSQTLPPSQNQRTLKNISDLLENKANDDIQTCSINGKNLTAYSISDLLALRTYFEGLVRQETNSRRLNAGLRSKRVIRTVFPPVGGRGPATGPFIPGY